jgi:hypothetical protein
MAEGRRPGGLTALAVINFVFSGLAALFAAGIVMAIVMEKNGGIRNAETGEVLHINVAIFILHLCLTIVSVFTLITSGVGYLKQKRVLGRIIGHVYAVCSLVGTAVGVLLVNETFGLMTIVFMVYPLLTLILVNTTFKDDLVN